MEIFCVQDAKDSPICVPFLFSLKDFFFGFWDVWMQGMWFGLIEDRIIVGGSLVRWFIWIGRARVLT